MNKNQERKEFKEYLTIADKRVLDNKQSKMELIADDEIFVLVNHTYSYWISNYGRLTNNLRGYFYIHKMGNAHYTLTAYDSTNESYTIDTYCEKLVAEHFLERINGCNRIWHIDRDKDNCHYKNLVCVNDEEYLDLERGVISLEEIGRQQKYIPYITLKSNVAYSIWNGIYKRCYVDKDKAIGSFMNEKWLDPKTGKDDFAEWYNASYYECDGESMHVDKDLLFPGNKEYSPEKCCILPQTINTMLSNCKKHRVAKGKSAKMDLPLGVRYNSALKMYYGEIKPFGHDEVIQLSHWDTAEEAFSEYKRYKQADILMMAAKYKNKIPQVAYDALVVYNVRPYVED